MTLLDKLGLAPSVRMRGAPAGMPPPGSVGAAASAASSARALALGPPAEGPEFDRLYALMAADGSHPLDRSNSKGGARDNEVGLEVAGAFARVKGMETAWYERFESARKQAATSEGELVKVKKAQQAFTKRADSHDDVQAVSGEYLEALAAVKQQAASIGPLIKDADAALDDLDVAMLSKRISDDRDRKEDAQGKLDAAKEEAKEREELFKGALGLLGKVASPAEWSEIAVEGLMFVDEQLFKQLPKQEIAELKKRVDEATATLRQDQGEHDIKAIRSARKKLDAAHERLLNARDTLRDKVQALARAQRHAATKFASADATRDVAKMIASSHKMQQLMAAGRKGAEQYLSESAALKKQVLHAAELFAGFPGAVKMTPGVDPTHARLLGETARRNEATLKSWSAYLDSLRAEVESARQACIDMSDQGFMKNYNQIQSIMQKMLSLP